MASKYWIKLYHEMLDDPKVGRMSDRLCWRMIQCFLLAGEIDRDGLLQATQDMAWRFRMDKEELETDLIELQQHGILEFRDGIWFVLKFADRQAPVESTERWRRWRDRQRKKEYYGETTKEQRESNVTQTNRLTDKIRIDKKREDTDLKPPPDKPIPKEPKSVRVFREVMGFWPPKEARPMMDEHIGDEPEKVKRWQQLLVDWKLAGYRKGNIAGMLDAFKSGGLRQGFEMQNDDVSGSKAWYKEQFGELPRTRSY